MPRLAHCPFTRCGNRGDRECGSVLAGTSASRRGRRSLQAAPSSQSAIGSSSSPIPGTDDLVVDLGAGTGLLTLALAPHVQELVAVDISERMLERLDDTAAADGVDNVEPLVADLRRLPLKDESATLVVSNYAFHHLDDSGKELALAEARRILQPGGRLVICDMMFSLSLDARDRRLVWEKVKAMLKRGPAGVVRIFRNGGAGRRRSLGAAGHAGVVAGDAGRPAGSSRCESSCSRTRRRWPSRADRTSVLRELERAPSKQLPAVAEQLVAPAFPQPRERIVDEDVAGPGPHERDGVLVEIDRDPVARRCQPAQIRPGREAHPREHWVPGEHGVSHGCEAATVQVEETHAVASGKGADRWLVDAEAALGPASGRPPDESKLRIAPAEGRAAGDGLRIERAAAR